MTSLETLSLIKSKHQRFLLRPIKHALFFCLQHTLLDSKVTESHLRSFFLGGTSGTTMSDACSSVYGNLSPQYALKLAKSHLENARRTTNPELVAVFYNEARAAVSQVERPTSNNLDQSLREEITQITSEVDKMLSSLIQEDGTQAAHSRTDHLRYARVEYSWQLSECSVTYINLTALANLLILQDSTESTWRRYQRSCSPSLHLCREQASASHRILITGAW